MPSLTIGTVCILAAATAMLACALWPEGARRIDTPPVAAQRDVCAIPPGGLSEQQADTISPASRCAMIRLAIRELAKMPSAEPHIAPGDTARITGADVWDLSIRNLATGAEERWRQVELDLRARPRLFVVSINRDTDDIRTGFVHRGGP